MGELKLYKADLTEEGSYDDAISGCEVVFHVATPVNFASKDPEVTIFIVETKTIAVNRLGSDPGLIKFWIEPLPPQMPS